MTQSKLEKIAIHGVDEYKDKSGRNTLLLKNGYKINNTYGINLDLSLKSETGLNTIISLVTDRQIGRAVRPNENGELSWGLETGFNIRSSIAGRILQKQLGETPLGVIGAESLVNHLTYNLQSSVQKESVGRVNLNPFSLLAGESFLVQDYDITTREGIGGRSLDFFEKMSGTQFPTSPLVNVGLGDNQGLINKTGRGQSQNLFKLLELNNYRPGYKRSRGLFGRKTDDLDEKIYPNEHFKSIWRTGVVFDDIIGGNYKDKMCGAPKNDNEANEFTWVKDSDYNIDLGDIRLAEAAASVIKFTPNSLLFNTQNLFNSGEIDSPNEASFKAEKSETQAAIPINGQMSKGSAVTNLEGTEYCRTWNTFRRYNSVCNLQKNSDLWGNDKVGNRHSETNLSILDDNGFAKVAPYYGIDENVDDIKKYMFSIENLAWADSEEFNNLPNCEKGNGDPMNRDIRGRIMWFPPYIESFIDNTSVNWNSNEFIGRGEPIYTYNNTERTGMLTFKVIVDHPSWINIKQHKEWLDDKDKKITSVFAGCGQLDMLRGETTTEIVSTEETIIFPSTEKTIGAFEGGEYRIYFPNDVAKLSDIDAKDAATNDKVTIDIEHYETHSGRTLYPSGFTWIKSDGFFATNPNNPNVQIQRDTTFFALNEKSSLVSEECFKELLDEIEGNPGGKIRIFGYASPQGTTIEGGTINKEDRKDKNRELSNARATNTRTWLEAKIKQYYQTTNQNVPEYEIVLVEGKGEYSGGNEDKKPWEKENKKARFVEVQYIVDGTTFGVSEETLIVDIEEEIETTKDFIAEECLYFKKLKQENKFAFDSIAKKINYFHPAFHSTTPEGFNKRLTFLEQCTRQGPSAKGNRAQNLAFGRPPICILRIGDFYYTRIVIDNLSISYEPIVWDLNPEGIGVQPMIANIDISFKYIGGQSLRGPITKLQNAVSYNFFANTEMYEKRSDSINDEGKLI